MKIAVVAVTSQSGERGGAERFYEGLVTALNEAGAHAELVSLISNESSFEAIQETLLSFYDLDLSEYDGAISTKAPSHLVRHPNHICYLVHTMRVFYDMFDTEFKNPSPDIYKQREFIQKVDTAALIKTRKLFTIGYEVSARLLKWNGLQSEVLHPPLLFNHFKPGNFEYVFLPSRLHRWKRIDLIINAFRHVSVPVALKIAGAGEDEFSLRELAADNQKIEFLGRVSDRELVTLYSNALVVPFVPKGEDYGYVTLEAFKSEKPVITCKDSGEPAHFIINNVNGFLCEPQPEDIAGKINFLYHNKELATAMGKKGKVSINHIKWDMVANKLLQQLS